MTSVLITGSRGFLGRHVRRAFEEARSGALLCPPREALDLLDAESTTTFFARTAPRVVIHLAARVGGIAANAASPATFFRENMQMGLNVLEAARIARVSKTVVVGTTCSYPRDAPLPLREEDLWSGYPEPTNAPYGVAKRALFTMAEAYHREYAMNVILLVPANLYGPFDHFELETSHVIPAMIRKLDEARERGEPEVNLWGDGTPTRDFLYAADAAEAILRATELYDRPEPVNVGSGVEVSIRDLAARIAAAVGFEGRIRWDASRPNGQPRRRLDVTRARERFGFVATTPLEEGLAKTIAWWREREMAQAFPDTCPAAAD